MARATLEKNSQHATQSHVLSIIQKRSALESNDDEKKIFIEPTTADAKLSSRIMRAQIAMETIPGISTARGIKARWNQHNRMMVPWITSCHDLDKPLDACKQVVIRIVRFLTESLSNVPLLDHRRNAMLFTLP